MGRLLFIDVLFAVAVLTAWYFWFARSNRRRGASALRWVQVACAGKGRIVNSHWQGTSLLKASLHLPSRWFDDAKLTVRLLPRPLPIQWLMGRWHKQKETLTFEADLGCAPNFRLDVFNHRWCGHNSKNLGSASREWTITKPGPIVLTTREKWSQELNPVVSALMASREKNFLSVRFHPDSPHFSATIDLDRLSDQRSAEGLLNVLLELAEGASARQL